MLFNSKQSDLTGFLDVFPHPAAILKPTARADYSRRSSHCQSSQSFERPTRPPLVHSDGYSSSSHSIISQHGDTTRRRSSGSCSSSRHSGRQPKSPTSLDSCGFTTEYANAAWKRVMNGDHDFEHTVHTWVSSNSDQELLLPIGLFEVHLTKTLLSSGLCVVTSSSPPRGSPKPPTHCSQCQRRLQVNGSHEATNPKTSAPPISISVEDSETLGSASSRNNPQSSSPDWTDALLFEPSDIILIVDSNPEIRSYIKALCAPFCQVIEASDGPEALALATVEDEKKRPHIVVSDMYMPETSGHDLLAALRANERTCTIPFVFLSTCHTDTCPAKAIVAGADDFIRKPFKPRELIARVHLHMQMGKRRVALERKYIERERELAITVDYSPVGIVRVSLDGYIFYANDAFLEPSGLTHEALASNKDAWVDQLDPADVEKTVVGWDEIRTGTQANTEMRWRWKNGRCIHGIFTRLDLVTPELTGVLVVITDVTEAEERLHEAERGRILAEESKRQQELLIDLTSHEIRTPVSAILQCSSLVKENLCVVRDELRRTGTEGFVATEALLQEIELDVEALESIYQCGLIQERIAGDVLSFARIQLDMLNVHEIELDLRAEANKIFAIFVSESIMNSVDMNLEFGDGLERMMIRGIKTDPVRFGQVVMNLVTNAMRFTSNAESKRITIRFDAAWEPPAGYATAGGSAIGETRTNTQTTSTTSPADDNLRLCVPSSPSATAAPPNGKGVPEDTPLYLYVSVQDSGPGMPASEQAMLFKRFQQGNKMIHTRYGGSGLGLFICKKITQLLGGDIQVESREGEGTTFRFFITTRTAAPDWVPNNNHAPPTRVPSRTTILAPMLSPPESPDQIVTPPLIHQSLGPSPLGTAPPTPKKMTFESTLKPVPAYHLPQVPQDVLTVLIVEDNLINQTVLKRQLCKAQFQCDVASNGEEALAKIADAVDVDKDGIRHSRYDVILMDVEMPIMDGITAIRTLRQKEVEQGVPSHSQSLVIALTGNARPGQIVTARSAGFDDVVIKPYKLPSLVATIREAVAAHRPDGYRCRSGES